VSGGKVLSCGERMTEMFIRRGEVPQGSADSALRYRFCPRFCMFWADSYVKLLDGKRPRRSAAAPGPGRRKCGPRV
jgi:hypothetical protein